MDKAKEKQLMLTAAKARMLCVEAVYTAASGHPGGSLSCIDALTELYFDEIFVLIYINILGIAHRKETNFMVMHF